MLHRNTVYKPATYYYNKSSIIYNIYYAYIIDVAAPSVSVRLTENSTSYDGLVEVYYAGKWGLICGNYWGDLDAKVNR